MHEAASNGRGNKASMERGLMSSLPYGTEAARVAASPPGPVTVADDPIMSP